MDRYNVYTAVQTILRVIGICGAVFIPQLAGVEAVAELMELSVPDKSIKKSFDKAMTEAAKQTIRELGLSNAKQQMVLDVGLRLNDKIQRNALGSLTDDALSCAFAANDEFGTEMTPYELRKILSTFRVLFCCELSKYEELSHLFSVNALERVKELVKESNLSLKDNTVLLERILKKLEKFQVNNEINDVFLTEKPSPLATFKGREDDISKIRLILDEKRINAVVSGVGGIGKSEICKKLILDLEDEILANKCDKYSKIAWIRYATSIKDSLLAFFPQYTDNLDLEESYKRIISVLKQYGDKLLLFIDNVTDIDDLIRNKIFNLGCRVLITSRLRHIPRCREYEIGKLSVDECKELFYEFYDKRDDIYLSKILKLIDYHTLVIELLAKTIYETRQMSIEGMYNKLVANGFNLKIDEEIEISQDEEIYSATFAEALSKLFTVVNLNDKHKYILLNFALLPYLPINAHKFEEWLGLENLNDVNYLIRRGWLKEDADSLLVHPAIQETARMELKPTGKACIKLIESLTRELYVENTESFVDKLQYIDFAISVVHYLKDENTYQIAILCSNVAVRYSDKGDIDKALEFDLKAIEIKEQLLEPNNPSLATSYGNIAMTYKDKGNYDKAMEFNLKAIEIKEQVLEPSNPSLATLYGNIAMIYCDTGEYDKAMEFALKDIEIREQVLEPNHPSLAISYGNIAMIYKDMSDYDKAMEFALKDIEISEQVLEPNHPSLATSYGNIALIYREKGDYNKAMEFALKDIDLREQVLEPNHPSLATSYSNITLIYRDKGDYNKAMEFALKDIELREQILEPNHPFLATSYNNIAFIYEDRAEYNIAMEFHNKALFIREKVFGKEHTLTKKTIYNLERLRNM